MHKPKIEPEIAEESKHLEACFALAGYLLEAQEENAVILAVMRVSTELLGARGSAFMALNEWKQSTGSLQYGETEFLQDQDWQARLTAPETRFACRHCLEKQAGSDCILLQGLSDEKFVFCVSLRREGREIGIVSYYFDSTPVISEAQHYFLGEMVRLADMTLSALRVHAQAMEAARCAFSLVDVKNELIALDVKNKRLVEQLEYRAVLEERTRLAREIHDGFAQTLAFLKLEASRIEDFIAKGEIEILPGMLQACRQTLSDAYLDARQAIENLPQFPEDSLTDWIEASAVDFRVLTGTTVDVSNLQLEYEFPQNVKAQLIRIVQEALNNIRKHAEAQTVTISVYECEREAVLEIRDDGRGFTAEETQLISQYGLRSMRDRAESVGAEFQIASTPAAGTVVRVRIPIVSEADS